MVFIQKKSAPFITRPILIPLIRKIEKLLDFAFFSIGFVSRYSSVIGGYSSVASGVCGFVSSFSGFISGFGSIVSSNSGVIGSFCCISGWRNVWRSGFFNSGCGFVNGDSSIRGGSVSSNGGFSGSFFSGDGGLINNFFCCSGCFGSCLLDAVRSSVCVFFDRAHEAFAGCWLDTSNIIAGYIVVNYLHRCDTGHQDYGCEHD